MSASGLRKAVFLYSAQTEQYSYPAPNPFKTERATMARDILLSQGLLTGPNHREVSPPPAERSEIERFHTPHYLDVMLAAEKGDMGVEGLEMGFGSPECPVFVGMYDYAALACGATLAGARLLLDGEADVAFNPSGGYHHAGPARASGFCYLNDVVLGCMALADAGRRVLFLDIDVHHGDGVQNAFYDRRDVMTISLHQSGRTLFPGTGFEDEIGEGEGKGYCANVPLPEGTYDQAYLRVFRTLVLPLIGAYNPDVIVLEIGMDTLSGDPLARLSMTNNAPADVVGLVMDLGKPVLATGGGGYHPENTARGWALAWSVLCGEDHAEEFATGLGGVMLESTDWQGGLRDRVLVTDERQRARVEPAIDETIRRVRENLFPLHGLPRK